MFPESLMIVPRRFIKIKKLFIKNFKKQGTIKASQDKNERQLF